MMKTQIPDGVKDCLPAEFARRQKIMQMLINRFGAWGYEQVQPPVLEYYDLYEQGNGSMRQQALVKTFDRAGRILTLRPEFTTPIARMATTRLWEQPHPLRLSYMGVAFDNQYDQPGRTLEFTQAGVELMGLSGPEADAEVIALAATAMQEAGLTDYLIDLGQVDFFKGLMEEAGLEPEQAEELRVSVEQKNMLAMEMQLTRFDMNGSLRERIMALPMLYGGAEVLEEAAKQTSSKRSLAALDNLRAVYQLLKEHGVADKVTIDLGMVHSIDYYSGVIFRGMGFGMGVPILSGGRYDHLLNDFGKCCPATGFALGVERLVGALGNGENTYRCVDVVAAAADGFNREKLAIVEQWRKSGLKVELCYEKDPMQAEKRAEALKAEVRFI